uniref:RNA helicase n=1 Tax=Amphiprion ocellaris TaxID=80972 RepID=A0AAQ5X7M5_AMPOC
MASSESDKVQERLIEDFTPRLREYIRVEPVLRYIDFIDNEQKELIMQKARTEGNLRAADLLISAVVKEPHPPGWFTVFVAALNQAGCKHAADYMQLNLPSPEVEAENDSRVRLVQLLSPSLVDMKTDQVCAHCVSEGLLTADDDENIRAEIATNGLRSGASELLRRIVRGQPSWYSTFLKILRETEHKHLYELTGDLYASGELPNSSEPSQLGGTDSPTLTLFKYFKYVGTLKKFVLILSLSEPLLCIADGSDLVAEAKSPEKADIVLRDYQMDVARPALEGKNIIICLPTGSGKTRVAVYITKKHLDGRRAEGKPGKVVVLVNKIPLVEQHYSSEFLPFLKHTYKVERVSGDSQLKISFAEIVAKNDIIICTAQILENYLERSNTGEDEGINLSDLTLIVIDECHHTQKGEVYNHIMMRYLKQKYKNIKLKKEQKKTVPLPQILGLTASPGVGKATKMKQAEEHILHDPFGDVIKKIMLAIHAHAGLSPTCDLGSQNYEQWVGQNERKAAKDEDQKVRVCTVHLLLYNEGLNLSNTIRMSDALSFLKKEQEEEIKKKATPDGEHKIQITDTERFLFNLFKENKAELERLAKIPEFENDSLSKLRTTILHEFSSRDKARGIIFTRTRRSAIALSQWIQENPKFEDIEVKPAYVIGGGDQSNVKPMTAAEQKDVLKKFHSGDVNLLVATTVAEEGLDIPACNFVIRYGLSTNEIAMIQAQGRGRAEDSSYTVVDVKNSGVAEKECVNEYRENMMNKAIAKIKVLNQAEYDKRITDLQLQAIVEKKVRTERQKQKVIKKANPSDVKFSCRHCSKHVCTGDDIQIIESMHRVNVTSQFCELFIQRENPTFQERLLDYETNSFIACKQCGQTWGSMMVYRGIDCPCLDVKNFVVRIGEEKISKCNKWSELPVRFSTFDYTEHASQMAQSSDEEEME